MKKRLLFLAAALAVAMMVFTACGKSVNNDNNGGQTVAVTGVTLNQTTATLALTDSPLTLVATVAPTDATNKTVSWTSSNAAVATVAGGVVTPVAAGSATVTVTTQDGGKTATCIVTVGAPLTTDATGVVIGGIKWARCNVNTPGTFAANPQDAGMFYQWNSAIGWSATDPMVDSNGSTVWLDSWVGNGATSWESANDPCPAGWRMPTSDEFNTLANAGSEWTTTPAPGRIFGSGSNIVFFPATGYRSFSSGALSNVGSNGYYWSAAPPSAPYGYGLYFSNGPGDSSTNGSRAYGFTVRCVAQ